ncbi:MAG: hypothetical protein WC967_04270 [Balneolaceae bacterium]
MKRTVLISAFIVFSSLNALAQQSGFDIFNFAPTPNTLALSEATTAVPQGASSVYSNPALLSLMPSSTIDLGYSRMIGDANNIFGGINFREKNRAIALTVYRSGDDGFEQRDTQGPSNGNFSVNYLTISSALSYDFKYFAIGASAQYIYQEVYLDKSFGYSLNAGLAREFLSGKIRTGFSVVNLGKMNKLVTSEPILPTALRMGGAVDILEFTPPKNSNLPILVNVSADYVIPIADTPNNNSIGFYDDETYANFGINFNIAQVVELKTGFKTGNTARPLSFGVGFITDILTFNYALIPFNTGFGTVHSIGLQYKF